MSKWISVKDELPKGEIKVIALYYNRMEKSRMVMAQYVKENTVVSGMGDGANDEYNEEMDEYYTQQGWYERIDNWDEWTSIFIHEGRITHWMPLPTPPGAKDED